MQDVRYAVRMFLKNPLFTGVAVLTLALGIGANAAIYTVVEAVLLEPLPFRDAGELTLLYTHNEELGQEKYRVSPMDFDDWRTMNGTFAGMSGFWPTTGTVTENDGNPTRVSVVYTTEDYFDVLGASALQGRTFTADDGPGSAQIVILSEGFWLRRFGGDPDIVGRSITLDGGPLEVVGILRGDQTFPEDTDLWTNMTWPMQIQSRGARWMSAVGRLGPTTALEAARTDMTGVADRIAQENPDSNRGWTATLVPLHDELVGDARTALLILLGATGLILLIACATVANLLLSRAEVRASEMAVRVAFGAPRGRLARQLLTESLLLALAGAGGGLLLAQVGIRFLLRLAPVSLPREGAIGLDGTVLSVVLGVTLLTGVLFGMAPVVRLLKGDLHTSIRQGGRGAGHGGRGLQRAFVTTQFALALVLVVGAGLLVRSFENVRRIDTGFAPSGVVTAELDLSTAVAETDAEVIAFYEQLRDRIAALPGVEAVGDASTLPLSEGLDYTLPFQILDRDYPEELELRAYWRPVAPGFLEAMGTPLVSGRSFDAMDRVDAPGVAMVNEAFVRRYFPDEDPLGERIGDLRTRLGPLGGIHVAGDIRESEIVGVVKDVTYDGLRAEVPPAIYLSGLQTSVRRRTLTVRTRTEPTAILPLVRRELEAMNSSVALTRVQTLGDIVSAARSRDRFSMLLLGLFGVVALVMAAVGVYGVLAYAVEQRTGEVGIRMALGAGRGDVRGLILKDGLKLIGAGLAVGLLATLLLSGVLASQLYGVDPREPRVYAGVLAVLLAVGVAASLVPAHRATRIDPLEAMRTE